MDRVTSKRASQYLNIPDLFPLIMQQIYSCVHRPNKHYFKRKNSVLGPSCCPRGRALCFYWETQTFKQPSLVSTMDIQEDYTRHYCPFPAIIPILHTFPSAWHLRHRFTWLPKVHQVLFCSSVWRHSCVSCWREAIHIYPSSWCPGHILHMV